MRISGSIPPTARSLAKAVQLCLSNDIRSAEDIKRVRVSHGVAPAMAPPTVRQISVPTTISGGEFSDISGVTNERSKVKEMLRHPGVIPRAVILDPGDNWAPLALVDGKLLVRGQKELKVLQVVK